MALYHPGLMEVARRDPRYAYEAYEFLFEAYSHTQKMVGRSAEPTRQDAPAESHVSGQELCAGAIDLARREFGRMARVVFRLWGVNRTDDLGEIVFNLIDANLLSKQDSDQRSDFHAVIDLDEALLHSYQIETEAADQ
ncbi:MAG: Minf_1886 family protein [Gemmatimonadales bacterium]